MKNKTALQAAGIVAAGVVAYLVISRTMAAGGNVVKAAEKIIKEDLNPASDKNIVTTALQSTETGRTIHEKVGNFLGRIFDPKGYAKMLEAEAALKVGGPTSKPSDLKHQAKLLTGDYSLDTTPDQSAAEDARLRRAEATAAAPQYAQNLFDMYMSGDPYNMGNK